MMVSYILVQYKKSKHIEELITACWGHDLLEDTDTTFVELATEFTPLVASLIQEMTSDIVQIKLIGKNQYLMQKMSGLSNYGLLIKLADRLHNVSDKPSDKYKVDTIIMMDSLFNSRSLTKPQLTMINEILKICR
jgi:(p)ppGpp synthase/HD superfamily hydrolase